MRAAAIAATAAAAMLLAGCAPTLSGSVANRGGYPTVGALRDAYVAAGGSCTEWEQTNVVDAASESGSCDAGTVLSVYASTADRDEVVAGIKQFDDRLDLHLLIGDNWIINSDDVEGVRSDLGGTLVTG